MDICLHGLYSPWFRAQQSLCSIVYFKLSLHIRMEELKGLMSSTGKISPRHGNRKNISSDFHATSIYESAQNVMDNHRGMGF